ncbi:NmrA family NAD(P)-binding protein [Actinomadura sp. CNU-125]|uniref:NmrA family NAD(P)-binding protein n=1 Tax=Actinomadura sp. CNU-125 TaxID=1904961 RepID=UPI0021CCB117|nr:NmrA family NAD(P)-binding protein [Actinomadura sp. CNU-125]
MILIIGATGVIGRRTVEALLHDGVDVSALTRDPDAPRCRRAPGWWAETRPGPRRWTARFSTGWTPC